MTSTCLELREYPSDQVAQQQIASAVFGTPSAHDLQPYLRYHHRQCRQLTSILMNNGDAFPLKTADELLAVIKDIRDQMSHDEMLDKLAAASVTYEASDQSILQSILDLALRLLTMVDVGVLPGVFTGRDATTWTSGTLADLIKTISIFDAMPKIPIAGLKLEPTFNACSLDRIADLDVRMTTNLKDHLQLREDKVVYVFHYAAFLQAHRHSGVFPAGFVAETLQTLAILFPKSNREVSTWYRRNYDPDETDPCIFKLRIVSRRIEDFTYWRDRLVILKEALDEARPST